MCVMNEVSINAFRIHPPERNHQLRMHHYGLPKIQDGPKSWRKSKREKIQAY